MIIKYTNTREDYEKSLEFIFNFTRMVQSTIMVIASIIVVAYVGRGKANDTNVYIIITAVIMNYFFYRLYRKQALNKIKKVVDGIIKTRPTVITEKVVTFKIDEDEFITENSQERVLNTISTINRIIEKDDIIFIFTEKRAPLLIIPIDAFSDISSKDEFIKIIKLKSNAKYLKNPLLKI